MSRLRVEPEQSDESIAAFRNRAKLVEGHEGFVDLQIWRSDRDASEVVMVSRWRDKNTFTAYMRSVDHRTSHGRMSPALKAAIHLERLEQMHTYDVVAQ